MIATPNRDQIKYTSATVQDERIFKKLKLFFELRRDDESPFSAEEIVNAYGICKNGKSFASRPGDVIFLLSASPVGKKAAAMLRVRKAVGLYGLVSLVPGMILEADKLGGDYDRVYYVASRERDGRLFDRLARESIGVRYVGTVVRKGHYIASEGEIIDEITVEEQQENEVRIPLDKNYEQGYIAGLMEAFEGVPAEPNGNIGYALGIFSAMFDIRCDRSFTYSGAKKGDGLFLFTISSRGGLSDKRARLPYKRISKGIQNGGVTGCVVFNDGNVTAAKSRLIGEEVPEERPFREGVWYVLVSSSRPLRGGYYLGRIQ